MTGCFLAAKQSVYLLTNQITSRDKQKKKEYEKECTQWREYKMIYTRG